MDKMSQVCMRTSNLTFSRPSRATELCKRKSLLEISSKYIKEHLVTAVTSVDLKISEGERLVVSTENCHYQ